MGCVYMLRVLLEVRLPHTSSIITIRQILGTPVYKSFIPALKGEAFSCKFMLRAVLEVCMISC